MYDQNVTLTITNCIDGDLTLRNIAHHWGRFCDPQNRDREPSIADQEQVVLWAQETTLSSCGRSESPSGTQGQLDIYDGETMIGTVVWSSPYGSYYMNEFGFKKSPIDHYDYHIATKVSQVGALGIQNITIYGPQTPCNLPRS